MMVYIPRAIQRSEAYTPRFQRKAIPAKRAVNGMNTTAKTAAFRRGGAGAHDRDGDLGADADGDDGDDEADDE